MAGSLNSTFSGPRWLLAELTYSCPLQCPYCSNPVDFARLRDELDTESWLRVLTEARQLGAVQLGFSGGEPLARQDLEVLVEHAHGLGYYTNLITSGYGLTEKRIVGLKAAGLDHIQLSIQASRADLNDYIAGTRSFEHKLQVAGWIKAQGYPMVLCVVIHRQNIEEMPQILEMATALGADYLELANTQYHGWALLNRDRLLPTREQFKTAEAIAQAYKEQVQGRMKIYYVVPDYYEGRPKACMNGWGTTFLTIAPDGIALPCHSARELPDLDLPSVREHSVREIWYESKAFQRFRGLDWMQEPCRSCPHKAKDFGGCRCQAYQLTGDPAATDPTCDLSPRHNTVRDAVAQAYAAVANNDPRPLIFRNPGESKRLTAAETPAAYAD